MGFKDGGDIANLTNATISSTAGAGIYITGGMSTVINSGLIVSHGTHTAVDLFAGGSFA